MMRIKCPHCGAGNRESDEATTCWQCGNSLWGPANPQTYALKGMPSLSATTSLDQGKSSRSPRFVRRDLWIAALAAVLALLLFVTVGILYIHSAIEPDSAVAGNLAGETRR